MVTALMFGWMGVAHFLQGTPSVAFLVAEQMLHSGAAARHGAQRTPRFIQNLSSRSSADEQAVRKHQGCLAAVGGKSQDNRHARSRDSTRRAESLTALSHSLYQYITRGFGRGQVET